MIRAPRLALNSSRSPPFRLCLPKIRKTFSLFCMQAMISPQKPFCYHSCLRLQCLLLEGHAVTSQHFKDSAPTQRPRVFSISLRAWQASEGKTSAQSHGISSDRNIRDFLWRWSNYFDQTPTNLPSSFHKLFIAELFFTCLRRELGKGINLSE